MKAAWFATTFQKSFAALMCFTGKATRKSLCTKQNEARAAASGEAGPGPLRGGSGGSGLLP